MRADAPVVSVVREGAGGGLTTSVILCRRCRRWKSCWGLRKTAGEVGTDSWRCGGARGTIRRSGAAAEHGDGGRPSFEKTIAAAATLACCS